MKTITRQTIWAVSISAFLGVFTMCAWADDDDSDQGGGSSGDNTAAYLAQQAYWQAWDHWLTIYQEHQQAIKEENARLARERLDRQLYNPPMTEIWSAAPLNQLLTDLIKLKRQGIALPEVPLPQELLEHVNLTSGLTEGNVSIIEGDGRLSWPLPLTSARFKPYRDAIDPLIVRLVEQAKNGRLNVEDMKAIDRELVQLDLQVLGRVNDWGPNDYMEAKRFLASLRLTLKVFRQPDAPSYFNRDYAARGKTVNDLVQFMNESGLSFAPAATVDKRAYIAFHRALAACDMAANNQAQEEAASKAEANAAKDSNPLVNPPKALPGLPKARGAIPPLGR